MPVPCGWRAAEPLRLFGSRQLLLGVSFRAVEYLHKCGIPDWVTRSCALGYADGHSLGGYLRRRSGLRVAQDLGLLTQSERDDDGRPSREFLARRIGSRSHRLVGQAARMPP